MLCGKKKQNSGTVLQKLDVNELRLLTKHIAPYENDINTMDRQSLCTILGPYISKNTTFLSYHKNSCYLDSTLVALLTYESKWVIKKFLHMSQKQAGEGNSDKRLDVDIRKHLQLYYSLFHSHLSLSKTDYIKTDTLRKDMQSLSRKLKIGVSIDWTEEQNDPADFLNSLSDMLNIRPDVQIRHLTSKKSENRFWNSLRISSTILLKIEQNPNRKQLTVGKQYPLFKTEDERFMIEKTGGQLYIEINRGAISNSGNRMIKLNTCVVSTKNLGDLKLTAILIHHGAQPSQGHYTCVFFRSWDGVWVWFDNMSQNYHIIGKRLKNVWEFNNGVVQKNCVGFMYAK